MARPQPAAAPQAGTPYAYPTPAMMEQYTARTRGLPGGNGQTLPPFINTSNMGAPTDGVMTTPENARRLTWRDRFQIFIFGADAPLAWMNPQQPLQPIVQAPPFGAVGRQWDYPVGLNTRVTPRSGEPIGFKELAALAEYDVLRIMIERVKDKILAQKWTVGPKDDKAKRDSRSDEIEAFLEYPDKLNCWDDWCRMLMDQVIVYDAPAVWLRPTRGGDLYSLEILDGSMITPKIMPDGRLPPPEYGPAYQQVLKGMPAVDYIQPLPKGVAASGNAIDPSTGLPLPELYYRPRYKRVQSVYGFSAVEQIVRTIQIGVAQEQWLFDYFEKGSTPDLLLGTPENWNPSQIAQMQDLWDSLLLGNLQNRRGTKFIPGGIEPIDTKAKALMDAAVQEWLVRVMCFSLGLNPMPFVKMMNKGQEETHHAEAAEEGLKPWLEWLANFVNTLIAIKWGYRDVVFRWVEENPSDPKTQAEIDKLLLEAKVYHPDEIRAQRGEEAMPDDMRGQMNIATFNGASNATALPPDQQAEADERAEVQAEAQAGRDEKLMSVSAKAKESGKATAKAASDELMKALMSQPAPIVNVAAPIVNMPAIEFPAIKIDAPVITLPPITMPEIKLGDTFVEVGGTNVRVDPPKSTAGKTVSATRNPDGTFTGTITDGAARKVTSSTDDKGNVVAKVEAVLDGAGNVVKVD